ncbi:MAG: helix-turn-helix transcriptional regulator [Nocardioides sp.]|nr:helix-turn-helix transcriptional regulator [Nocardioides sp.]
MPTSPTHPEGPPAMAWSTDNCTVGRTMAILGERWTVVVLREVFNGVRRFDDIRRHSGIPRQVLSNRLASLVEQDILRREPYRPEGGGRTRHEYRPTAKGLDLYLVLVAVAEWGDTYLADAEGPPVEFVHRDCGERVHPVVECAAGHRIDTPRDVVGRPGPGAKPFEG